ncbi:MAG: hypothetical protein JWL90_3222 [Chthoniobacteraceae bacterium]|nr:hypothetical protein [Chthoniobacteraceae bacterium]
MSCLEILKKPVDSLTFVWSVATMATVPVSEKKDLAALRFNPAPLKCSINQESTFNSETISGSTSRSSAAAETAISSSVFTFNNRCDFIRNSLQRAGFLPDRIGITTDGSYLMQYLSKTHACVDVYPSGEVILIIRKNDVDSVYDMRITELKQIATLLKDAGVSIGV